MKTKYDALTPRGGARTGRLLLVAAIAPAGVLGSFAAARASGVALFQSGSPVTVGALNANFAAVTTAEFDGGLFSVGPTLFCGATAPTTPFVGGYPAAKQLCEAACGSRPAHVCSTSEIVRVAQLGVNTPDGWVSGDAFSGDCEGWAGTQGDFVSAGPIFTRSGGGNVGPRPAGALTLKTCVDPNLVPFLCCK